MLRKSTTNRPAERGVETETVLEQTLLSVSPSVCRRHQPFVPSFPAEHMSKTIRNTPQSKQQTKLTHNCSRIADCLGSLHERSHTIGRQQERAHQVKRAAFVARVHESGQKLTRKRIQLCWKL